MIHPITGSATTDAIATATVRLQRASYISLVDADNYFNERLENSIWFETIVEDKTRALLTAVRYIDRLNYSGSKSNSSQNYEFPRNGGVNVPLDIQYACCEIAYNLLDGRDPEFESEHVHVGTSNLSTVKVSKDTDNVPVYILHNIPSSLAWSYLRPYLLDTHTLCIQRTN